MKEDNQTSATRILNEGTLETFVWVICEEAFYSDGNWQQYRSLRDLLLGRAHDLTCVEAALNLAYSIRKNMEARADQPYMVKVAEMYVRRMTLLHDYLMWETFSRKRESTDHKGRAIADEITTIARWRGDGTHSI